jgi:hypothetical protein
LAKAPRGARAPAPKPVPAASVTTPEAAALAEPATPLEAAVAPEADTPAPAIPGQRVTDQVNTALETMTIEQLEASAEAPGTIDVDGVWLKMTTGLSGPHLSLSPRDKHRFAAPEAQRLIDAGFAEFTEAPEA